MGKKKKKAISKRRAQTKATKSKKTKTKSHNKSQNIQYSERPAISAIAAPPGFRSISMSQAMLEYAKPIIEFADKGIIKDLNDALQLAMPLWNYGLDTEQDILTITKKVVIKQLKSILKFNSQEANDFFDMMIQRKEYLFPKELQPKNPMTMFIRKVKRYVIKGFDYNSLTLSNESYIPQNADHELVELLNQIDEYIDDRTEYEEWEDIYFKAEKKCSERFDNWLEFKGVEDYRKNFIYNVEIYLKFIYIYAHQNEINLRTVTISEIEEFFSDHVLRKVLLEPQEYVLWPPALKLFYAFLNDISYLVKPEIVIKLIDKIEPVFIKILKIRYS